MAKYIKNYLTVSAATEAQDILSPNVTYIQDREKLLMADLGDNKELQIVLDASGNPQIQEKSTRDYLTFTCLEDGGISMTNYGSDAPNIEYSLNGGNWTTWNYSNIALTVGDVVKMKGINANGISSSNFKHSKFAMTGKIAASGNIMCLIDGEKDGTKVIPGNGYCFCRLFEYCRSLTTAPELPATTLTSFCYRAMFYGCTALTTAPAILPATTLAEACYYQMFWECSSLTAAPELPATTLANYCYWGMFYECSSLTTAPALPATTLAESCYNTMFDDCTSLTTAPELPATTLAEGCYSCMFEDCGSLNYIKCLATNIDRHSHALGWVNRVSYSGTFIASSGATGWCRGGDGIPEGWTITPPIQLQCEITYDSEYGTPPEDKSVNIPYALTAADLPELSEPGYTFDGWDYSVGDVIEEDTWITASWTKSSCEITYDSEYGTPPEDKTVNIGYELTDEDLPELEEEGYVFLGWDYSVGDTIEDDTTITAEWEEEASIFEPDDDFDDDNHDNQEV